MPSRRRPGRNEQQQREMREQSLDTSEPEPTDNLWRAPRPGEWWALAPGSVIHIIARVNDKLRVTYVVPICGGKPSQARVEVPFSQLRDPEYKRQVCDLCLNDPRTEALGILRYAGRAEFKSEEFDHAIERLEAV